MIDAQQSVATEWEKCAVNSVRVSKIFYVRDGRNAWHSTWVQRYYSSSFHVERRAAMDFAEKLRVQGSVFDIVELPVVQFSCELGALFVSELNTSCPLANFRPPGNVDRAKRRGRSCSWYFKQYVLPKQLADERSFTFPIIGRSIEDVHAAFQDNLINWMSPENRRTVLRLLSPTLATNISRGAPHVTWRSSSVGPSYRLNWHASRGLSQASCCRIADTASRALDELRRAT
jgi:hypothetical protein